MSYEWDEGSSIRTSRKTSQKVAEGASFKNILSRGKSRNESKANRRTNGR